MKFCEIITIIVIIIIIINIIIIKYTFVVLVLGFSCPKKEEATRDRRKFNSEEFDAFTKYCGDETNEVLRDGASVFYGEQRKCIQFFFADF